MKEGPVSGNTGPSVRKGGEKGFNLVFIIAYF
jgi:hypothetical protein